MYATQRAMASVTVCVSKRRLSYLSRIHLFIYLFIYLFIIEVVHEVHTYRFTRPIDNFR